MRPRRVLLFSSALLLSGCLWPVHEKTDLAVAELAARPLDLAPPPIMPSAMGGPAKPRAAPAPEADVQTTAFMQAERKKFDVTIPPAVPGSEAPLIKLTDDEGKPLPRAERERILRRLYQELPPLPEPPKPQPGPDGKPYTLADLQRLAAANSPALHQAAAAVETAKGNLIQARAYPNPSVGWEQDPSNNGSTAAVFGIYVDQVIRTFGKQKLAGAAAERDLLNAELALKRARSDLATAVRTAYYGLLVAQETARVTLDLARFTDEVYRIQVERALTVATAAPYEPASLRAQSYTIRLAYKQAIANYLYAWQQLVAAVGLRHLPLSEVAGYVDRFIPRYDYDTVLAHILRNHTDVLTAQNTIAKARYNLKLAQITPYPDIEVRFTVQKDIALPPQNWVHTLQFGGPLPVWDQNKGNIIAAQGALEGALEQPHLVEVTLTGNLATTYAAYKTNLDALEYYRRHVLPDQVRYYRGVYSNYQIGLGAAFGDLVQAQQTLVANVTTYLSTLGSFWTAVVQMASLLQTEDLFQLGKPEELSELPDLEHLPRWSCAHGTLPATPAPASGVCEPPGLSPPPGDMVPTAPQQLPSPRRLDAVPPIRLPIAVRSVQEVPGH